MDVRDPYMRDSDAFSWYMETDPLLRSTVVTVVALDGRPDLSRLVDRVDRASRLAPGFRHKVVQAPMRLANPRWTVHSDFDMSFHVRHIAVPPPGTMDQVVEYACQSGMAGFDRERPLWEFTFVDGLHCGRSALIMKIHHALTDGVGGMEMAKYLFDLEAEPGNLDPTPEAPVPEALTTADLVCDALGHNVARLAQAGGAVLQGARASLARTLRHPATAMMSTAELIRSIARTVRPVSTTLSPVMTERHLAWHYSTLTVPLDALLATTHALELTLNDAFLAAISGGLLRYHDRHGASAEELRVTMPISIRAAGDPIGGNRITLMRFKVPTNLRDPADRMHRIHELSLAARHERAIPYTNAIAAALNVLPRSYVGDMLKHVDFLASNVPGIDVPVYLAGTRVAEWYAFGPTIGAALNATLLSYEHQCYIGVNLDTGAIPDFDVMLACLEEGFREITNLSAAHPS